MEKTPESVAAEIAALRHNFREVSAAIDKYAEIATRNVGDKDSTASGDVSESHKALFLETNKLLTAVRGPVDMVISNFEHGVHTGCLRAVMEMGIFQALPSDGSSATATSLSEKLGVEKDLLIRLMRNLTVIGPFAEVGKEEYSHTPYSQIYLVPSMAGFFKAMCDEFGPVNATMYAFFREHGFKTPTSNVLNPYCFAHQTGGKTVWEYLNQYPERNTNLNDAQKASGEANPWTVELFPFASELKKFETSDETVLLVDIGGGKGHVSKLIRGLTQEIKGKIVLQDRPEVLGDIAEELTGIEKMEYDFYTTQPIQGALIYYIRHCLHDWPDEDCVRILQQIAAAIKPGVSRLVISESILSESNVDLESAWIDITMMGVSGSERTLPQWERILDNAGFKLHKTYQAPGTAFAAIEAYLK